jgi:hypothetical protein
LNTVIIFWFEETIAKSGNTIKTTWNIIKKETEKIHSTKQMTSLFKKNEKVRDPEIVADAFSSSFVTIA